jgi:hypothetical protein
MKFFRLLPFIFLFSDACIEKLELPLNDSELRIVVDGLVTDQPGPYTVNIFRTSPLQDKYTAPFPVNDAVAIISDDLGNQTRLTEVESGVYETDSATFKGVIGRKYKLSFTTNDGKAYESTFQKLSTAGSVNNVYAELVLNAINRDDPGKVQHVFRIYIDAKGEPGQPNLFRWRWKSIFEAHTFPEHAFEWDYSDDMATKVSTPLPCSGFIVGDDGEILYRRECECCQCWVDEFSQSAMVSNNRVAAQETFNKVRVAEIPLERRKFQERFYIKVQQLSVSEEVYLFWKNIQAQQAGTDDIFQPNVIHIQGNIKSTSDASEEVSGVFAVSGIAENDLFIDRSEIPIYMKVDSVYEDCRLKYPGSTNIKPSFW